MKTQALVVAIACLPMIGCSDSDTSTSTTSTSTSTTSTSTSTSTSTEEKIDPNADAKVRDCFALASGLKTNITEYWIINGKKPKSAAEAEVDLEGYNKVGCGTFEVNDGSIVITFHSKPYKGAIATLIPDKSQGPVMWSCNASQSINYEQCPVATPKKAEPKKQYVGLLSAMDLEGIKTGLTIDEVKAIDPSITFSRRGRDPYVARLKNSETNAFTKSPTIYANNDKIIYKLEWYLKMKSQYSHDEFKNMLEKKYGTYDKYKKSGSEITYCWGSCSKSLGGTLFFSEQKSEIPHSLIVKVNIQGLPGVTYKLYDHRVMETYNDKIAQQELQKQKELEAQKQNQKKSLENAL